MVSTDIMEAIKTALDLAANWTSYGKDDDGNAVAEPGIIEIKSDLKVSWSSFGSKAASIIIFDPWGYDEKATQSNYERYRRVRIRLTSTTKTAVNALQEAVVNILQNDTVTGWEYLHAGAIDFDGDSRIPLFYCNFEAHFRRFI